MKNTILKLLSFLYAVETDKRLRVIMRMKANGGWGISTFSLFTIRAPVCHGRPSISKQYVSQRGTRNSGVSATHIHIFNGWIWCWLSLAWNSKPWSLLPSTTWHFVRALCNEALRCHWMHFIISLEAFYVNKTFSKQDITSWDHNCFENYYFFCSPFLWNVSLFPTVRWDYAQG